MKMYKKKQVKNLIDFFIYHSVSSNILYKEEL